jgi:hypothetical protein
MGVAASLSVKAWERAESVAFLEQFKKLEDPAGAGAVADALGDLPLALAQAAAYMDETVTSYADYLNLFNTRRAALWGQQPPPDSYPDTVATTWTLSLEEAEKAAPGAADLMNLCAWLAPDDIPRDMLRDGSEHVPEPLRSVLVDPLRINSVVAALRRSGATRCSKCATTPSTCTASSRPSYRTGSPPMPVGPGAPPRCVL